jgi:hypothetical protein
LFRLEHREFASSEESVGEFQLRKLTKHVILGEFEGLAKVQSLDP